MSEEYANRFEEQNANEANDPTQTGESTAVAQADGDGGDLPSNDSTEDALDEEPAAESKGEGGGGETGAGSDPVV